MLSCTACATKQQNETTQSDSLVEETKNTVQELDNNNREGGRNGNGGHGALTEDNHEWSEGLTLVSNLIFNIIDEYSADVNRIYGTGQSQGGMSTIAISDKYPDLYAAQFLVACQWDTDEMAAMKDDNVWIVVCEGDPKAYPGMNEATEKWETLGTKVARTDMWDSTSSPEEFAKLVDAMEQQNCSINYTVFEGGNHMYTWTVAYTIEGIRDWMFAQSK